MVGHIVVKDLGLQAERQKNKSGAGKGSVFSRKRLSLEALQAVDLDLQLDFRHVIGNEFKIDRVTADVVLEEGELHVGPVRFAYSGGELKIDGGIDARNMPAYTLTIVGSNVEIGNILSQFQQPPAIEGRQHYDIRLASKGYSAHEMAANLQGDIHVVLENGTVRRRELEVLFLNVFDWLFTYGLGRKDFLIDCGITHFKVKQGVADLAMLYWDGPKLRVTGKGTIDLGRGELQVLINLRKKKLLFDNNKPIELTGPLADPDVKVLQLDTSLLKAGGYVFAPFVMLSYDALGSIWDLLPKGGNQVGGCSEVVK